MLVVLDTSVIISAFTSDKQSSSAKIIKMFNQKQILCVVCSETMLELKETIGKSSLKKLPYFDQKNLAKFLAVYKYNTLNFSIQNILLETTSRDLTDNIFLKLAVVSQARYLLSLDKDLLVLKEIQGTKIIKPSEFLELI